MTHGMMTRKAGQKEKSLLPFCLPPTFPHSPAAALFDARVWCVTPASGYNTTKPKRTK